jgi:hypothetical protein
MPSALAACLIIAATVIPLRTVSKGRKPLALGVRRLNAAKAWLGGSVARRYSTTLNL